MTEFEPCTTPAQKRRHWSDNLAVDPWDRRGAPYRGRAGQTLCGNHADDEERANSFRRRAPGGTPIVIADLPPCKQCDKSKAAREHKDVGGDG
jgi:hypothetical protein